MVVVGRTQSKLEIVRPLGPNDSAIVSDQSVTVADDTAKVTLDVESTPVAVLPLPRKLNGVTDVLVLQAASTEVNIVPNAPNTTITVDRTDDPIGGALAAAPESGVSVARTPQRPSAHRLALRTARRS